RDVLQYVFGKLFGRHRFSPTASFSRTWEGPVGGMVAPTRLTPAGIGRGGGAPGPSATPCGRFRTPRGDGLEEAHPPPAGYLAITILVLVAPNVLTRA